MGSLVKGLKKNGNFDGRVTITDVKDLAPVSYLYVRPDEITKTLATYEEKFGKANVVEIPEFPTGHESKLLAKYEAVVSEETPVTQTSHVVAYFSSLDFSNIVQNSIRDFLINLNFKTCTPTPDQSGQDAKIHNTIFYNCRFFEISDKSNDGGILRFSSIMEAPIPFIFFINCDFDSVVLTGTQHIEIRSPMRSTGFWGHCSFKHVKQIESSAKTFVIDSAKIDKLETAAKKLSISNTTLKLIHHKNLDDAIIETDNVKIEYDRRLLRNISDSRARGFLNTYYHLQSRISLISERHSIARYINYFESKLVRFKRILFALHGGYTKVLIPALLIIISLLGNLLILEFCSDYSGDILTGTIYPLDLFKNYIFKDFSWHNNVSYIKVVVFLIELFFVYISFAFVAAIRKLYGFKVPK